MYTSQDRVQIVVPLTPPTVNHYKKPITIRTHHGERKTFMLTSEARGFLDAVALLSRGETLIPEDEAERKRTKYALFVNIYQGRQSMRANESKQRDEQGDGDNYWKCVADGLGMKHGQVIHDDKAVRLWCLEVWGDDRDNPRTEIDAVRMWTDSFHEALDDFTNQVRPR